MYVLLCIDLSASRLYVISLGSLIYDYNDLINLLISFFSQLFPLFPLLDDEILAIDEGESSIAHCSGAQLAVGLI